MLISKKTILAALVAGTTISLIAAECPNACSGRGSCGSYDMCTCDRNWQGSDCSQRTCPFGLAHVDTPKGDLDASTTIGDFDDTVLVGSTVYPLGTTEGFPHMVDTAGTVQSQTAHDYMECSNKGLCDRSTGECECLPGYDGAACQRASCPTKKPTGGGRGGGSFGGGGGRSGGSAFSGSSGSNAQLNECSGHGTCETISEIAFNDNENIYELWDKDSTMGCNCDPGYDGPDCSERKCKYGIDPLYTDDTTARVTHTTVRFETSVASALSGTYAIIFYDVFGEDYQTEPLTLSGTGLVNAVTHCTSVKNALEALPNGVVPSVDCSQTVISTNKGVEYTLTFTSNPGNLKELELNQYLDGSVSTVLVASGTLTTGVFTKVIGEFTEYFSTRCDGLTVKVLADSADSDDSWTAVTVRPGSLGYISGASTSLTTAEQLLLKACLADADDDASNNVDVQNWDKGVVIEADGAGPTTYNMIGAYPHAIKVVPIETSSGYTAFSYGEYHLLWFDDSATNKEFRVANINNGNNVVGEATESYVYTTKGTVQQMGWSLNSETEIADNSAAGASSARIVGWFDVYTNKIYTNYDTSCENNPSGHPKNLKCVEKGAKLFVVDGCWGGGDRGAATVSPFFGGADVFNCADSTSPSYNTGNLYTVTKVYTNPLGSNSTNDPTTTVDAVADPTTKHDVDTFIIEVNANFGWTGVHGDPENSNTNPTGATRDALWSDNTGVVILFHFTPSTEGNFEYVSQCSNRGTCDKTSGICKCYKGYTGNDCGTQNALAV